MKPRVQPTKVTLCLLALLTALPASASVTMDWVTIGDAGNAADSTGYGAVNYAYRIGKYEVTNEQYGAFLNAAAATDSYALYHTGMGGLGITRNGSQGSYTYTVSETLAKRPVVYVSWYDAARMANWMHNGGTVGASTETGAYTLNGVTSGVVIARNADAQVYIPSQDEWYKAAYYNGLTSTYSLYPNGLNSIDTSQANYDAAGYVLDTLKDVGSFVDVASIYGTYDQAGNVREWNDAVTALVPVTYRVRGGSIGGPEGVTSANGFQYEDPTNAYTAAKPNSGISDLGFRLASISPVPEPSTSLLGFLGAALLLRRRRTA